MNRSCDVLVIGGGPGGTPAAMALAQMGKSVLLVEAGSGLGGTCLFEGCIPSKIFRETAQRLRDIALADQFGIHLPHDLVQLDWHRVQARKRKILQQRSEAAARKVSQLKRLQLVFGRARLTAPQRAVIEPFEGENIEVSFKQCILATGSEPRALPVPGGDLPQVYSSDGILDIDHIPESLVVIGGGAIGIELAQIFQALGAKVTLMERGPRILGPVDEELALALEQHLISQGIRLIVNCSVRAVCEADEGLSVQYDLDEGGYDKIHATAVLSALGRQPRVQGLGLENAAVSVGDHGIVVDEALQTTTPDIYAVGDVIGQPMFAHWATAQALALARHLMGQPALFPKPEHNTATIYSSPELGMAGLTEAQAKAKGIEVGVARYDFSQDARAQITGYDSGMLKIVYNKTDHKVIGVHALVEGAADLMGEAALLVRATVPLEVLATAIHPHPTLTESFVVAARAALAERR